MVTNDLATAAARNLAPGWAGQIKLAQHHLNLLNPKQNTVRHSFVGFKVYKSCGHDTVKKKNHLASSVKISWLLRS
jgi:hypothetical protein